MSGIIPDVRRLYEVAVYRLWCREFRLAGEKLRHHLKFPEPLASAAACIPVKYLVSTRKMSFQLGTIISLAGS